MKKLLPALLCLPMLVTESQAQTLTTGPSSSQSPYVIPTLTDGRMTSILTVGDAVGGYKMAGIPDGMGAYDNNDGTFTLLMNHELGNGSGTVRAHGSTGTFVSRWVIRKSDLTVLNGSDLMQRVNLWDKVAGRYVTYYSSAPSTAAALGRFCSADLPAVSAFYNSKTGKGTTARIFMNGEETGANGRPFGHIASGVNAGSTYELPYLGKASWENYLARPMESDTTVVIGLDDATPGQLYVYVGTKTTTGTEIDMAGLSGGKLYGIAVAGLLAETNGSVPAAGTAFSLAELGNVRDSTGAAIEAKSTAMGVTQFLRPEDGCWDPTNDSIFYFATTNSFSAPSRLWKLHFSNPGNILAGGAITAVMDGTEGQRMMDNLTVDHWGHSLLVEDVGGNAHIGRILQYDIKTDAMKVVAAHDTARFLSGGSKYLTQDEEATGIFDVQEILGPGMFLVAVQAHYSIAGELVEGGQLLAYFNPDSYNANPEISVTGAGLNIPNGDRTPATSDNTRFGMVDTGTYLDKTFVIRNAGPAALQISNISLDGPDAARFALIGAPAFPLSVAKDDSLTLTVRFAPLVTGTHEAVVHISNNDFDEKAYSYAIEAEGVVLPSEINVKGNLLSIANGDLTPGVSNNTDYGVVNIGSSASHDFVIHNSGPGVLRITGINFSGTHASEFTLTGTIPVYPRVVAMGDSLKISVQFAPTAVGLRSSLINILNNDSDEGTYQFALQGKGRDPLSIGNVNTLSSFVKLYPNPTGDAATIELSLKKDDRFEVTLFDLNGRQVMEPIRKNLGAGDQKIVINTSNLPNGNYLVQIASSTQTMKMQLGVAH